MFRSFFLLLFVSIGYTSSAQSPFPTPVHGLTIEPAIKSEVEKRISLSPYIEMLKGNMAAYDNKLYAKVYQNDSLIVATFDDSPSSLFKSFYYWHGDTLGIDGAFGMWGGQGFSISVSKNNAVVSHMVASDDFPSFAYHEKDSLIFRLEVPCTNTKIILSEIPDSNSKQTIYGYVEFQSGEYYFSKGSVDNEEILPRLKFRADMKIYFKSERIGF